MLFEYHFNKKNFNLKNDNNKTVKTQYFLEAMELDVLNRTVDRTTI